MKTRVQLTINEEPRNLEVDVRDSLLDLLRDHLGLTGTKRGCDQGECGTCTVLMDGRPVNACMLLAVDVVGASVTTIEGLAHDQLNAIQQAFVDSGAVQCGFCTPGMIMSAKAFIDRTLELPEEPTRPDVRQALSGNLCRCTGYQKIVDAVLSAYTHLRQEEATHV
ncbi:MAG: (2Fe-2S)-binding protein [Gemmatimonadetes bacterium]|nr:(2Fe-2S)-binding protein [Gemmatimonadota bacterium]